MRSSSRSGPAVSPTDLTPPSPCRLSSSGTDFIVFCRKGQLQEIHWAGNPHANKTTSSTDQRPLEPRKSFKIWSETIIGKSRAWTDEEKETASVLCLVYGPSEHSLRMQELLLTCFHRRLPGKFIAVWREKESALAASQLTNLLLQNASHEGGLDRRLGTTLRANELIPLCSYGQSARLSTRSSSTLSLQDRRPIRGTDIPHAYSYLELALDGPIQGEVRDNLVRSHAASKSLIHVINDLLVRGACDRTLYVRAVD